MRPCVVIGVLLLGMATSQGQISPFNGLSPGHGVNGGNYRIILSGHLHGASNDRSGYPAATILANLDMINGLGADLFLSTGDLFLEPEKEHERYTHSLFRKMDVPLFNAPGNHDHSTYYENRFGPTHHTFSIGVDRIVLLDTERRNGTLDKEQLRMLEEIAAQEPAPRRVFIISHRPLWAEGSDRYGPLFEGNTRSLLGTNYERDVFPLIERIAGRSHVYWASGSMAGGARSSIFFQPHAPGITFIQTAIRNEPRDALLIADVDPEGITWSAVSLTGEELLAPEEYHADWWWAQRHRKEAFNWRLLPYLIGTTLRHPAFWYGSAAAVLLILGLGRIFRRGL
jgi:hypothetical protein